MVEAARWVSVPANRALKSDALANALQAQNWDPSVKALVPFPQVLQNMSDQLQWTQDLGNAFLAQQTDVLTAVAVRANGSLTSTAYSIDHLRHACVPNMRSIASRKGRSITAGNTSEEGMGHARHCESVSAAASAAKLRRAARAKNH